MPMIRVRVSGILSLCETRSAVQQLLLHQIQVFFEAFVLFRSICAEDSESGKDIMCKGMAVSGVLK